jgi:hypothetical protein
MRIEAMIRPLTYPSELEKRYPDYFAASRLSPLTGTVRLSETSPDGLRLLLRGSKLFSLKLNFSKEELRRAVCYVLATSGRLLAQSDNEHEATRASIKEVQPGVRTYSAVHVSALTAGSASGLYYCHGVVTPMADLVCRPELKQAHDSWTPVSVSSRTKRRYDVRFPICGPRDRTRVLLEPHYLSSNAEWLRVTSDSQQCDRMEFGLLERTVDAVCVPLVGPAVADKMSGPWKQRALEPVFLTADPVVATLRNLIESFGPT